MALVLALLLSGCAQGQKAAEKSGSDSGQAQAPAAEKPAIQENVSPEAGAQEQPVVEDAMPAPESGTGGDETVVQEPVAVEQPAPETKEFSILADDHRFDPSTISVSRGETVKITFNFNDEDIYYGGLDIKSDYFSVKYRKSDAQKSQSVEFVADKAFTFTSYWPSSGVKKASGKVEVSE
ncbi:MAG: hypothetical protein HY394_04995 [Candidatus Diapherotrites archaeon]|nr:hypothetical protein [Candidatus Diapherotrites archaeon]